MSDDTYSKDQTAQLVFNAEIKKDIEFIKNSIVTLSKNVDDYVAQFIPRVEVTEWKTAADLLHDGHDKRIRFLEKYAWAAIGGIFVLQIFAQIYQVFKA